MMNKDLRAHYQKLFKENGPTPAAVQYLNRVSQYKRFEVLTTIATEMNSIVDVGCGLGDLFKFLIEHDYQGAYLGLDFVPDFIRHARKTYTDYPKAKFDVCDIIEEDIPKGDYIFLSGVFNNKMEDNAEFMFKMIDKMYASCQKGVAFNAMSTYVDYEENHLYYSNPLEVFDYCKRKLTKYVVLKHDYCPKENSIPFEYTMFLYKL